MANEESRIKKQLTKAALDQEGQAASPQTTQGSPSLESQVQELQKTLTPLGPTPKTDQPNAAGTQGMSREEPRGLASARTRGATAAQAAGQHRKKKGRVTREGERIKNRQMEGGLQRTPAQPKPSVAGKAAKKGGKAALKIALGLGGPIGGGLLSYFIG